MYNKEAASKIVKKDVKFIPAGIQEDVVIKSFKIDVSPTGKNYFEITFEKNGMIAYHTEYEPRYNDYTKTEIELQTKCTNQYSRMLQVLVCYYKSEEIDFNGETFKEFAEYIKEMLEKADLDKKLRVKFVYNSGNYVNLPNYTKYTFIEPMELAEGETSSINQLSMDVFVKPIIADNESPRENESVNSNPASDLPF